MAEATITTVSRRSTRLFDEEQGVNMNGGTGLHRHSGCDEKTKEKLQRDPRVSQRSNDAGKIQRVDLGKDLSGLLPKTMADMGKQVEKSLQAVKDLTKEEVGGRPLNFGTVIPGTIYRSSFPMNEDLRFLETICLKTIVSLVNKEFSPEFNCFTNAHGIRHIVIEMEGTKAGIPNNTMQSIMEVVLNQENHPLLIHCNQGRHRTGCAVAVLRLLMGWEVDQILEEYKGHANPKVRECDLKYIETYQISSLESLFTKRNTPSPIATTLVNAKRIRFILTTAAALLIWLTTILALEGRRF